MTLTDVLPHLDLEEAAERIRLAELLEYADNPAFWVKEVLGEHLWSKQVEIAESVRDNRYTAVHSAHDTGKSFVASRIVAWWLSTHEPGEAFVVSTAPSYAQPGPPGRRVASGPATPAPPACPPAEWRSCPRSSVCPSG